MEYDQNGDNTQRLSQLPMVVDVRRKRRSSKMAASRHAFALGTMAVGTVLVLGLVVAMNSAVDPHNTQQVREAAEFTVEKKPPPKKHKAEIGRAHV